MTPEQCWPEHRYITTHRHTDRHTDTDTQTHRVETERQRCGEREEHPQGKKKRERASDRVTGRKAPKFMWKIPREKRKREKGETHSG